MRVYGYDNAGRIRTVKRVGNGSQLNVYNALGQRVYKRWGRRKTFFNYDEQSKLIGEYDSSGNAIREYVYFSF